MERREITEGVIEDIRTLKTNWEKCDSLRYLDFVKVWQLSYTPYIFCGIESMAELLEFTEELLIIAKTIWLSSSSYNDRIFGLYITAGFYYAQIAPDEVQINITLSDWKQCLQFKQDLVKNGDLDAAFLFCKLRTDAAFKPCLTVRSYGLEKGFRKYFQTKKTNRPRLSFNTGEVPHLQKILEKGIFEQLDEAFNEVVECGKKCAEISKGRLDDEDMSLIPLDHSFKKEFVALINQTKTNLLSDQPGHILTTEEHTKKSLKDSDCIGERRKSLKERAFAISTKLSETTQSTGSSPVKGNKKQGNKGKIKISYSKRKTQSSDDEDDEDDDDDDDDNDDDKDYVVSDEDDDADSDDEKDYDYDEEIHLQKNSNQKMKVLNTNFDSNPHSSKVSDIHLQSGPSISTNLDSIVKKPKTIPLKTYSKSSTKSIPESDTNSGNLTTDNTSKQSNLNLSSDGENLVKSAVAVDMPELNMPTLDMPVL